MKGVFLFGNVHNRLLGFHLSCSSLWVENLNVQLFSSFNDFHTLSCRNRTCNLCSKLSVLHQKDVQFTFFFERSTKRNVINSLFGKKTLLPALNTLNLRNPLGSTCLVSFGFLNPILGCLICPLNLLLTAESIPRGLRQLYFKRRYKFEWCLANFLTLFGAAFLLISAFGI